MATRHVPRPELSTHGRPRSPVSTVADSASDAVDAIPGSGTYHGGCRGNYDGASRHPSSHEGTDARETGGDSSCANSCGT